MARQKSPSAHWSQEEKPDVDHVAKSSKETPESRLQDGKTEFGQVLEKHLKKLEWTREDLSEGSLRYPLTELTKRQLREKGITHNAMANFIDGISRGQAYGITAARGAKDWRAPSRQMVNRISHVLAAAYEEKRPDIFTRDNVEALLEELLKAAGFASHDWLGDRWDEIIDAPMRETPGEPSRRPVRVGYFGWPGMAALHKSPGGDLIGVEGVSAKLVHWLLGALRLPVVHQPVQLSVADLYDRGLFMRVDLVAPFIGIPARRLSIGYSKPIGGWRVGQNFLVNSVHASNIIPNGCLKSFRDIPTNKIRAVFVQGGVSEQMVDALDLPDDARESCETFERAIEKVAIDPQVVNGRFPCFVGDLVTCDSARKKHPSVLELIVCKNFTMASPLVFGLPQRQEVLETVNLALELLATLKHDEFIDDNFIPGGVKRTAWDKFLKEQRTSTLT